MFTPHTALVCARIRRTAAVVSGVLVSSLALTGVAAASGPGFVSGNPDCASIQGTESWTELKIESPRGTNRARDGYLSVTTTTSGLTFDFSATQGVDAVIVKGGPNANVYRFDGEVTSGDDLHAPVSGNGQFYGLSHISFCYDRGTPPPPDPCVANPNGMDANGQPCTPPSDPCKTNPNGMDANGQPCTPPSNPCATDPSGMDANGQPCTPPSDPCASDPSGMDANGQPCTPPSDPCATNPFGMAANGQPCTPPADPCKANPAGMDASGKPCTPVVVTIPSLAPTAGQSLGELGEVVPAQASIVRLKRCVAKPFSAIVRGRGIRRVTFYVNGRLVRTMSARKTRYALTVSPTAARNGVIRISARVQFVASSGKRAQTLRMTALRCAQGAIRPQFTG
jgi:hypothetical protein